MQSPFFLATLILSGVLIGAALGALAMFLWYSWRSRRFREQNHIPSLAGLWRCQWFDDNSDLNEPKIEDTIEVQKWITKGEFVAVGRQPQFHLSYPIWGEIDPSRVVTLTYKAGRYPYEPNRGVVCMELSRDGQTMVGHWYGRRFSGQLGGGKVKCFRMPPTDVRAA